MRFAHTVEQVRAAEAELMARLPEGALMQRAAHGLAHAVLDLLGTAYGRRVLLLVGSGDNGGDALYAGVVLARRGVAVEAWLLSDQAHEAGLAALRQAGGRVVDGVRVRPDLVVDGIVGIGGRPGLRPEAERALTAVTGVPVVAVDTPSGVDVDTGELDGPHVIAELTVTFGTHKVAHLVDPAADRLRVPCTSSISGWPCRLPRSRPCSPTTWPNCCRGRPRTRTSTRAASSGSARARASTPAPGCSASRAPDRGSPGWSGTSATTRSRPWSGRRTPKWSEKGACRPGSWAPAAATGPSWRWTPRSPTRSRWSWTPTPLAHVDGSLAVPAVLTPHAGELARMLGAGRERIEARPLQHVRKAAEKYAATVLLKGRHTLIARPDGRVRVTTTGTPWLATAGAGDVLGGLIGALLAAGLDDFDAASVGSWLHGAAATLASREGPLTAGDVAQAIPDAVRAVTTTP